jgi:3-hexulose-6-phosphate synthase
MQLQLALDVLHTGEALRLAELAYDFVDLLEVGTPLLKHEGIGVVKAMRRRFPDRRIVVDAKTMDAGACEADFCFAAGADIVTVLGIADRATIEAVVSRASRYGGKVMVDLIGASDKERLTEEIREIGADFVIVHTGLDQQGTGRSVFHDLDGFAPRRLGVPFAVAGGITPSRVQALAAYQPDIVIVGAAITDAEQPAQVAGEIKQRLLGV